MKVQTNTRNYTALWLVAIAAVAALSFGIGAIKGPKYQFFDKDNKVISYHSVDSILKASYTSYLVPDNSIKVDLPDTDEVKIVKPTDILKGTYDSSSNTLVIEFNNSKNH